MLFVIFATIIFGAFSQGNIDLTTNLLLSKGFQITGSAVGDTLGNAVSSAGDVNNDGINDIIIAAKLADGYRGSPHTGIVYIIYGKQNGFTTNIDLSTGLSSSDGFQVLGSLAGDHLGYSICSVRDVNNDGVDDILIGARDADDPNDPRREDLGKAYVIYGTTSGISPTINSISALSLSQGFEITAANTGDALGVSVSSAGDFNKDGINDIIIGAEGTDTASGADAGVVYIIYGTENDRTANIDLTTPLSITDGLQISGGFAGGNLGASVSRAGDVNNDGIDDIIIGGPFIDLTGAAYIIYGKANGYSAHIDLANSLSLSDGFKISGSAANDYLGYSINSVGDVNKDGYGDIIIGAYGYDMSSRTDAGAAYIIYGKPTSLATNIDLSNPLSIDQGFKIIGGASQDFLGFSVSSAGDINYDGVSDIIVGARCEDSTTQTLPGIAYLIYGKESGITGDIDLSNLLNLSQGFQITGGDANNKLGYSISSIGDMNNDGVGDILVGAIYDSRSGLSDSGTAFVIYSPFCPVANCISCQESKCLVCAEDYRVYLGDSKCYAKDSCPSGTSANSTHCVYTLLSSVGIIQGTASKAANILSSSITIINFSNPAALLFAALAETLKYMKYMKIRFPPKLQYLLDQPEPELYSIPDYAEAPDEIENQASKDPLEENFDKYGLYSSFLVNYWNSLLVLTTVAIVVGIACLGTYLSFRNKIFNYSFNKLKEGVKWNYLLGLFTGSYGPIAFFSSFEVRKIQFNSSLAIFSFLLCIGFNLITIAISVKLILIATKLSREKHALKLQKLKQHFKEYQITFEEFKSSSFLQQNCYLFSCFRLYLFYVILGFLFEYPMAQSILFNVQSLFFLLYLLIKRPFKRMLELIEAILLELVLLVVHGSVLGLVVLQETESEITNHAVSLGDAIIVCWSLFMAFQCIYLIIQIFLLISHFFKYIKNKRKQNGASSKQEATNIHHNKPIIKVSEYVGNDQSVVNESRDLMIIRLPSIQEVDEPPLKRKVADIAREKTQMFVNSVEEDKSFRNNMAMKDQAMTRPSSSAENENNIS